MTMILNYEVVNMMTNELVFVGNKVDALRVCGEQLHYSMHTITITYH